MGIPQKMKSRTTLTCSSVDFTAMTDIQVRIQQGNIILSIEPTIIDAHTLTVDISKVDAMKLLDGSNVEIMILWTEDGFGHKTEIKSVPVEKIIGDGYGN